jgi:uncharacterized protein
MRKVPESVARFLEGKRFAVAGVSRRADVAANSVFRKLRDCGYEVFPVNPNAEAVEGVKCYPDVLSIPGQIDGVVIATHRSVSASIVRQCKKRGVMRVWFHRSFGEGSVSEEAVEECKALGMESIVGGCPLMFCDPVDIGHKCMRWWLQQRKQVPM